MDALNELLGFRILFSDRCDAAGRRFLQRRIVCVAEAGLSLEKGFHRAGIARVDGCGVRVEIVDPAKEKKYVIRRGTGFASNFAPGGSPTGGPCWAHNDSAVKQHATKAQGLTRKTSPSEYVLFASVD